MKKIKVKQVGIVAEDNSDFETVRTLIKRIIKKNTVSFKKKIGNGCGKLKRKLPSYATELANSGCDMLIVIHDLDRNQFEDLKKMLDDLIQETPIVKKFVCIPVQEIEAWFISDTSSIQRIFNLKRKPNFKGRPESIDSPKETLGKQIELCSEHKVIFLNTKHNKKIAENVSIELLVKSCKSFELLHNFILSYEYK